jgi:hypothetical protein
VVCEDTNPERADGPEQRSDAIDGEEVVQTDVVNDVRAGAEKAG